MPKLSVMLSNYNHAKYLPEAIGSVLAQTFSDWELVIVDDASTDDSVEVIRKLVGDDPRVHLTVNERNRGLLGNVPSMLARCRGEYVHWFASDDRLAPDFFSRAVAELDAHPAAAFCHGSMEYLYETTGRVRSNELFWSTSPRYFAPAEYALVMGRHGGNGIGLTSVVRRSSLERAGGFPLDVRWYADWYGLLRMAFREGACFIPGVVGTMRIRRDNYSVLGTADAARQEELIARVLDELLSAQNAAELELWIASGALGDMGPFIVTTVLRNSRFMQPPVLRMLVSGVRSRIRSRADTILRGAGARYR